MMMIAQSLFTATDTMETSIIIMMIDDSLYTLDNNSFNYATSIDVDGYDYNDGYDDDDDDESIPSNYLAYCLYIVSSL